MWTKKNKESSWGRYSLTDMLLRTRSFQSLKKTKILKKRLSCLSINGTSIGCFAYFWPSMLSASSQNSDTSWTASATCPSPSTCHWSLSMQIHSSLVTWLTKDLRSVGWCSLSLLLGWCFTCLEEIARKPSRKSSWVRSHTSLWECCEGHSCLVWSC